MEELIPILRDLLQNEINITYDESKLLIQLKVTTEFEGKLAEPKEIIAMLQMFGGLREDVSMEIIIDNQLRQISLKFNSNDEYDKIKVIMEKIWDKTIDIFTNVVRGNFRVINDVPEIDE